MTLVTEGGREMNREEKKEWLKKHKDRIEIRFNCGGIDCSNCPFLGTICGVNKEMDDILFEVFAEEHGYVKKEDLRPKVNEEFIDNLAALLQRGATFSVIKNVIGCEGELWMGQDDQEDNWYRWLKENLFVEDTEDEELEQSNEKTENTEPIKSESDPVNPSHYQQGDMQTIEKIMIMLGKEVVIGFCKGNAFKYTDRAGLKGSAEVDKAKADWYLRLAEKLENTLWLDDGLKAIREFLKEEVDK